MPPFVAYHCVILAKHISSISNMAREDNLCELQLANSESMETGGLNNRQFCWVGGYCAQRAWWFLSHNLLEAGSVTWFLIVDHLGTVGAFVAVIGYLLMYLENLGIPKATIIIDYSLVS